MATTHGTRAASPSGEPPAAPPSGAKRSRGSLRTIFLIVVGIPGAALAVELFFVLLHGVSALVGPRIDVDRAALASGRLRVLCLGESTTATGYPAVLQATLDRRLGKDSVVVINAGWRGMKAEQILGRLPRLVRKYQPDIAVTMIGINDELSERRGKDLPWYSHLAVTALVEHVKGTDPAAQAPAAASAPPNATPFTAVPRAASPEYVKTYREIVDELERDGVAVVAVQYPMRPLAALAAVLGENPRLVYVDNEASFQHGVSERGFAFYFADDFAGDFGHMTEAGMSLISESIAERMTSAMTEWREGCASGSELARKRRICRFAASPTSATPITDTSPAVVR